MIYQWIAEPFARGDIFDMKIIQGSEEGKSFSPESDARRNHYCNLIKGRSRGKIKPPLEFAGSISGVNLKTIGRCLILLRLEGGFPPGSSGKRLGPPVLSISRTTGHGHMAAVPPSSFRSRQIKCFTRSRSSPHTRSSPCHTNGHRSERPTSRVRVPWRNFLQKYASSRRVVFICKIKTTDQEIHLLET